eukprot:TRINITY_DN2465_c0_g2_i2.p1 TRINITY_DN2465_c0_g2~~TRINITY_DN2465_c0_g2_i2.p1  ORF type:complete len:784 (-),score=142.81 TRINITY_DN2465_c0_g2_i2:1639-3990(-)
MATGVRAAKKASKRTSIDEERKKSNRKSEKSEDEQKSHDEKRKKEPHERRKHDEKKRKKDSTTKKSKDDDRNSSTGDEPSEAEEYEIAQLESFHIEPEKVQSLYQTFPFENFQGVFDAYDKLQNFARELNTKISNPEYVLIGASGDGKTHLIESIVGTQILNAGSATKRPLFLNMINNAKCTEPKVTIKRDIVLKGSEFDHDVIVPIDELSSQIERRNKLPKISGEPIFVQYEHMYCCNLTLIDTPGIPEGETASEDLSAILHTLLKLPHRKLICVEQAKDWDKLTMLETVKQYDPEFTRTTFVFTRLQTQIQNLKTARAINRFLQAIPDVTPFYVTLLSGGVRAKYSSVAKFQEKLYQAVKRDLQTLEQLQYDRQFEPQIGALRLRESLLHMTWKQYQDDIPQILKKLRSNKTNFQHQLRKVQEQLKNLGGSKLRSIASNYVVDFLQVVDSLLAGTSEGNPAVNGQTLEEEKAQSGDGDWVDSHNKVLKFDPEDWGIPYWESKLYGGQQFERLLAEFKAVADHMKLPEVSMDDVATAAGINKLNNIPNYAWAASDLAQQKSQEEMVPLIEQTISRAVYIIKRLANVTDKILEARRKTKWESKITIDVNDIEMYPFFTYHVKDLFNKFIEETAKSCRGRCMDEFYGTRTVFWEYTEYADRDLPSDKSDSEETKKSVDALAKTLFERLRARITKNVLLKLYNFMLVPLQTKLWTHIQGRITTLPDSELEQKFEVAATQSKLEADEKQLLAKIEHYKEQEVFFIKAATHFSHPVYILAQGKKAST